jgi:hypothetical protein
MPKRKLPGIIPQTPVPQRKSRIRDRKRGVRQRWKEGEWTSTEGQGQGGGITSYCCFGRIDVPVLRFSLFGWFKYPQPSVKLFSVNPDAVSFSCYRSPTSHTRYLSRSASMAENVKRRQTGYLLFSAVVVKFYLGMLKM